MMNSFKAMAVLLLENRFFANLQYWLAKDLVLVGDTYIVREHNRTIYLTPKETVIVSPLGVWVAIGECRSGVALYQLLLGKEIRDLGVPGQTQPEWLDISQLGLAANAASSLKLS